MYVHRFSFGRRNNEARDSALAVERPKTVHQIAKEIRMQKIKEYEAKILAAKVAEENAKNDLLLNILPNSEKTTAALADDATEANSPGNSDNDDPTINDDDDEEEEDQTQQQPQDATDEHPQSPPGSPLSILSMDTKPVLIHPPRSIARVDDDGTDGNSNDNNATTTEHSNPLGLLCGCI